MATYKVPQDVEAEDKLLGPFTFRQFIFLIIAALSGYATFLMAKISLPLIVLTLPFFLVFGLLGVYRRDDQPVELYLTALLRFYFKPHKRIWNPDGILQSVQITAPKTVDPRLTDGLNQTEVRSRLSDLAGLMDTRGWSAKNVDLQEGRAFGIAASDRLVVPTLMADPTDVHESDDIMSPTRATVQNISQMAGRATQALKDKAVSTMRAAGSAVTPGQTAVTANPAPSMGQATLQPAPQQSVSAMTTDPQADILILSHNNDLSVSTIARQAEEMAKRQGPAQATPSQPSA